MEQERSEEGKNPKQERGSKYTVRGKPQTIEEEESGEIGGFTTPTYPPKPQFLFSIVFKTVFLIILTETHNYNLSSITT